jgi:hypothetical protein
VHFRFGSWSCQNALPEAAQAVGCAPLRQPLTRRPHCGDEWSGAYDVHHAREIVGEQVQGHLGGHSRQRLHQEVSGAYPGLDRAERVLDRLAPLATDRRAAAGMLRRTTLDADACRTGRFRPGRSTFVGSFWANEAFAKSRSAKTTT